MGVVMGTETTTTAKRSINSYEVVQGVTLPVAKSIEALEYPQCLRRIRRIESTEVDL